MIERNIPEEKVIKRNAEIVLMMENNPTVINNHNGMEEKITGLVEFVDPYMGLACCFDSRYYSLNACYKDKNNKLHCSTSSIAGVLEGARPTPKQLAEYNTNMDIFEFNKTRKIKCIHLPDGTKVYPAA